MPTGISYASPPQSIMSAPKHGKDIWILRSCVDRRHADIDCPCQGRVHIIHVDLAVLAASVYVARVGAAGR